MYSYDKYHHKLANDYNNDFFVSTRRFVNNLMSVISAASDYSAVLIARTVCIEYGNRACGVSGSTLRARGCVVVVHKVIP